MCWGNNGYGRLGDGTTAGRLTPVLVSGLNNVKSISTGTSHSCAALDNGSAMCWGSNGNGRLGDGSTTNRYTPVNVLNLSSIRLPKMLNIFDFEDGKLIILLQSYSGSLVNQELQRSL